MWPFSAPFVEKKKAIEVVEKIEPEKPSAHYLRCLERIQAAVKIESTSNVKCPSSLRTDCGLAVNVYHASFKGARIDLSQAELRDVSNKIWTKHMELLELERQKILETL